MTLLEKIELAALAALVALAYSFILASCGVL